MVLVRAQEAPIARQLLHAKNAALSLTMLSLCYEPGMKEPGSVDNCRAQVSALFHNDTFHADRRGAG